MAVDRARVLAVREPAEWSDERIHAALAACDVDRAVALVLARALAGAEIDAKLIAEILPGVRDPWTAIALCGLGSGDRGAAYLEAVRARRFPMMKSALETAVYVLRAAWRAGEDKQAVARELKRIARFQLGDDASTVLYAFANELDDPDLNALVENLQALAKDEIGKELLAVLEHASRWPIAKHVDKLPDAPAGGAPAGFTVRVAPRAGRNEPCPCGSGQKYKKCCADKDAQVGGSPIAGMSWDDYVTKAADRMSIDDIEALPLVDLARVDLAKLADVPLITAYRRFMMELQWDRASGVLDEWERRKGAEDVDDHRTELLLHALDIGRLDVAAAQLAKFHDPSLVKLDALELAVRTGTAGLGEVEAMSAALLAREPTTQVIDFAVSLLRASPALGILVARGCISAGRPLDNEMLADDIEDAREQLGLPSGDPAWDTVALIEDAEKDDGEDEEAKKLRSSLRATSARVDELEQELARKQEELKQPKPAPAGAPVPRIDRDREKELRDKIDELKGLVSEGNAERAELRRQMASASKTARTDEPAPAPAKVAPEPEVEEGMTAPRGVTIPVVSRRVQDQLGDVPQATAADALRLLGELAAGDAAAWRMAKPAQDMPRPVLMARVGIHYRLLFRIEDGMLHTLDFVSRENLDVTLKRLRTTRG